MGPGLGVTFPGDLELSELKGRPEGGSGSAAPRAHGPSGELSASPSGAPSRDRAYRCASAWQGDIGKSLGWTEPEQEGWWWLMSGLRQAPQQHLRAPARQRVTYLHWLVGRRYSLGWPRGLMCHRGGSWTGCGGDDPWFSREP